ncbi:MAG: hypothetical protein HYV95_11225 [Opitutae bacterium]|nr:hypothetical protein [Opitutae bacterium]
MKKTLALLCASLGLLALLAGCGTNTKVRGLSIELVKLEQAADGTFTATLRYTNPNVVAYNVASSTHKLSLNGKSVGTIVADDAVGIPQQFTLTHTGRLKLANGTSLPSGPASYQMSSALTLRLYGDAMDRATFTSAGTTEIVTR